MGFGLFDIFDVFKGSNDKASNDPNSPNYAGGYYNKSYDVVKPEVKKLFKQVNAKPLLFADESGFMPYQRAGMNEFARTLFGDTSANMSAMGMNSPQNYDAVVGSALTRALPQLFAIQNQNQFLPTQMANERISLFNPLISAGGNQLGPGIGYNNLNTANSNYWNMMNNIGSFWGGGGMKGAGGGKGSYFGGIA